jgi:hypothetical protein
VADNAIILPLADDQAEALRAVLEQQRNREKGCIFAVVNRTHRGVELEAVWMDWASARKVCALIRKLSATQNTKSESPNANHPK